MNFNVISASSTNRYITRADTTESERVELSLTHKQPCLLVFVDENLLSLPFFALESTSTARFDAIFFYQKGSV